MPPSPPAPTTTPTCDIFCAVVDNFGDIGVSWRLARQLAAEHGFQVRLWVDDLNVFAALCPGIDPQKESQTLDGMAVLRWGYDFPPVKPADLVIEAFGCALPERFLRTMSERTAKPVWVNLEYLSAENWVNGCHALPSPHPLLPLVKHFFFPGFVAGTGGLLRECGLIERRRHFQADPASRLALWQRLGLPSPPVDALVVSLFAYENPMIGGLLAALAHGARPAHCLVPASRALANVELFFGHPLPVGVSIRVGNLEIHPLPLLEHRHYDELLWACDLNFVRGEDSFVRAQWAGRPFIWHIYPQEESAHIEKLNAFLERYCTGLPAPTGQILRELSLGWNTAPSVEPDWPGLFAQLPLLRKHADGWATELAHQEDLAASLVNFYRSQV